MRKFEWAVIGSGVAGTTIAEILSREGHSVVLIEKNDKLSSETTRDFHEWLHTGALYTLIPGQGNVLRYILGAIDDILEFYSSYERMNLIPTESGLSIDKSNPGWFNDNYINFKYKIKNRKLTFPWLIGISRSIYLLKKIKKHDWLRRRAGELNKYNKNMIFEIINEFKNLIFHKDFFKTYETSDFTINSRVLLRDLITTSINNGLEISLNNEVKSIKKKKSHYQISCKSESFICDKVAICAGYNLDKFNDVKTETTYAPMSVVNGVNDNSKSFVELDYFPKNCINLLTKGNGVGLVGGISLKNIKDCDNYLDYVIEKHKTYNPDINEVERYIGKKTEITFKNQPRGYLFNIIENEKNIWSLIPGKFTLSFSMAPEFYRRVYGANPKKSFKTFLANKNSFKIVSNTQWFDSINN